MCLGLPQRLVVTVNLSGETGSLISESPWLFVSWIATMVYVFGISIMVSLSRDQHPDVTHNRD